MDDRAGGRPDAARVPTGKAVNGTWVTFNLAALVSGDGTYSVQIASSSNDGVDFASREGVASQRPQSWSRRRRRRT